MRAPTALLLLTSILALFSSSVSTPTDPALEPRAPPKVCAVPLITFETLEKPFRLDALVPKKGGGSFYVLLPPPSKKTPTQPYISLTKPVPPLFRLTKGILTTGGADYKKFPAYFGATVLIFPPVLQPLFFGSTNHPARFAAEYSCDEEGKLYLELRAIEPRERKAYRFCTFSSLHPH